jgi:putative transposase
MAQHQREFSTSIMCRVLRVSRSGFYAWLARQTQPPGPREMANQELSVAIVRQFEHSRRTYGAPRIHAALLAADVPCSRKRVAKLMQRTGLVARAKRERKVTTNSKHELPIAPNVLAQQFATDRPQQKWLADITYIATKEGWLYLAGILDLHSRRIVGWAMGQTMEQALVHRALEMALLGRKVGAALIHHSDRGSQYAAGDYQQRLCEAGITSSMSRRANCYDNSPMESFWSTLKAECADEVFATRADARAAIFEYVEVWYNRARRHSALGYQSPWAFEQLHRRALLLSTEST